MFQTHSLLIKRSSSLFNATKLALLLSLTIGFNSVSADELTTTKVTDSIHIVNGKGGNIGVFIGADGTYMIDDKFAGMGKDISSAVKSLGGDQPKYLFNTHFHGDHSGSNEHFGRSGSVIVAHHNVRKRLAEGSTIAAFNMVTPPAASQALPDITFDSDAAFHLNGERVRVYHIPHAHTDGDSIVHFEGSNVIHAGDTFFNGFFPFIDVSNGGSVQGMIDAANSMLALSNDQTLIIPGHGSLAKPEDLTAYRDMLVSANSVLKVLKAEGKTAEQAAAESPLLELEEAWGAGMFSSDKWISIVYDGI